MSHQGRRFCLTLNNYTPNEYDSIKSYIATRQFWIIGKEVGSKNSTPHLQIYFESKTAIRFSTLKKLNNRLHIEKAKGSLKQNFEYCSKEGNFETNIKEENLVGGGKENKIDKEKKLKEEKEEFEYHFKNHRFAVSDETYNMFITELDLDSIEGPLRESVFRDIRIYNECKHCYWCGLVDKAESL